MLGLEFDDSLKTYNPEKASHRSVLWLKERPFRAASFCLGLLCVLLLIGIIILVNHHSKDQSIPSRNLIGNQVQPGTSYNLTDLRCQQTNNLTKDRDQIRINNNLIQELDQLNTSYINLAEERDQLKTSSNHLIQERDQLQTSYNNLTQERDQLQASNKYLTKESNQLKTSNNNLTLESEQLRTSNKHLIKELHQLQTSNNNLTQERDLLQTSNNNLTEEMYQLKTINNDLTQERDKLKEIQRVNERALIQNETGCWLGWVRNGGSCYFLSSAKKSWVDSRQDCLNRGADLVIIKSKAEQDFIKDFCCAVWIGLHDREIESTWKWVDESPLTLSFWGPDEPNNAGNEDCAELQPRRKIWNDVPCSETRYWACQKRDI